jgi:hypothetical protein
MFTTACFGLIAAQVSNHRSDHHQHQSDGSHRDQYRCDVEGGGDDQAN